MHAVQVANRNFRIVCHIAGKSILRSNIPPINGSLDTACMPLADGTVRHLLTSSTIETGRVCKAVMVSLSSLCRKWRPLRETKIVGRNFAKHSITTKGLRDYNKMAPVVFDNVKQICEALIQGAYTSLSLFTKPQP